MHGRLKKRGRWRWSHLLRLVAVLVTFGVVAGSLGSDAGAVDPGRQPEPIDPPPVQTPPFAPPANGFTWSVAKRFGTTIADPDEPDTPALINYHYCAPERPNVNCGGDVGANKYTYDPDWVRPTSLAVTFDGCPTSDERDATQGGTSTQYRYAWQVLDLSTGAVLATIGPSAACVTTYSMPIDRNTGMPTVNTGARLTITDPGSSTPQQPILSSPFTQTVNPRDYLVVSMGDSYGSGEGNPDVPQKFATDPIFGNQLPWVQRGPRWEDKRCHRSAKAGPAQAALQMEAADPHSSVTFLSFACSGANIEATSWDTANPFDPYNTDGATNNGVGILHGYAGPEPPAGAPFLDDQVTQLEHAVVDRKVDALIVSGGGNDVGFGYSATACVLVPNCNGRSVTAPDGQSTETLDARVHDDLTALTTRYNHLADRLNNDTALKVGKLYITEYPDSTRNDAGMACGAILDDVIPLSTVAVVSLLVNELNSFFPFLSTGLLAAEVATGAIPPYGLYGNEVKWAGDTLLPLGGANADHGLDRVIADAVQTHAGDRVPWELVGGITADFQGTGTRSGGVGHGYCASDSWIRSATDATLMQGPYTFGYSFLLRNATKGTLHPTVAGHADYAAHIYNEHLKNLLPVPPAPTPPAPQFFVGDRNSSGNSYSNPTGTETVRSDARSSGWLVGCAPAGGVSCPTSSDRAVEEIVAKVNSNTTVKAAGLWINETFVDCATGAGLPPGVQCQQELLSGDQLYKWSLQFTRDGIYRLNATVTGNDDSLGTVSRELKVDLHDPVTPVGSPSADPTPTNGWYRSPVTVTFDVPDPGDGGSGLQGVGLQGIEYKLDGGPGVLVNALSQVPPGAPVQQAQVVVTGDQIHTLVFHAVDVGGRTSPDVTMQIKIDQAAPTISVATPTTTTYTLNQTVAAGYSCTDVLSGVATCQGTTTNGLPIDTASTGTKTFTVHATDTAGNGADTSVTYQVGYAICPLYDQSMAHKAGSTVPIRLQLCDVNGVNTSAAATTVHATGLVKVDNSASTSVDSTSAANPDNDFRYDDSLAGYIYNLKTTGLTTGTWQLNFTATSDGTTHCVRFDIR